MKYRKCEICGFKSERKDGAKRFFMARYPLDEIRCKEWVKRTGILDLAYVPIEKLHQLKFLCGKHFKERDFNRNRTKLKRTAVPLINLTAKPLSDEDLIEFPYRLFREQHISKGDSVDSIIDHTYVAKHCNSDHTYALPGHRLEKAARNEVPENVEDVDMAGSLDNETGSDKAEAEGDEIQLINDEESLEVSKPAMDVLSKTELTSFRCDACLAVISGVRYHCMQCADVDFCSECEARGNHDTHYVLRVPQYKPLAEVRSVLTAVQRALDSALAVAQELITIKDELDLKQEEDSETTIDPLLDPLSEPIFCNTSQENHNQKSVTNFNESNCDKAKEDMIRRHNDSDETNYLFFQRNNNEDRVVLPVYKSKCVKAGKTDYSFMGTDYKVIVEMNREIRDTNLAFKNVDKYRISREHQVLTPVSVGEPQKKRTRQS